MSILAGNHANKLLRTLYFEFSIRESVAPSFSCTHKDCSPCIQKQKKVHHFHELLLLALQYWDGSTF